MESVIHIQVLQITNLNEPVSLIAMLLRCVIFTDQRRKSGLIPGNEKAVVIDASFMPATVR